MSELDDIRGFIEVVDAGGFSRAAARLGLSKSIISRRVARLEEELGAQLLTRTTRGITPTEAGLEFKARAERALAELDAARDAVSSDGDQLSGRLRISAPLSFGIRHLAPMVIDMAWQHPALEIDISYSDRLVDLVGEGFDLAFRIGRLKDSFLIARKICDIHAVPIASPAYLERRGEPRHPADLAGHDCIGYTGATSTEWPFQHGRRQIAIRPQTRLRTDSGEAILQWVEAGLGISVLPTFICVDAIRSGAVKVILPDYPLPVSGLYAIRPPGIHLPRKVRVFIDEAVTRYGTCTGWDLPQVLAKRQAQVAR